MTQRITILPEHVTNRIAAGEVVERPASVIKELIENALDAGATDIAIEITAGGRRRIRITDNGHGMSREDALLSLERHATSKITSDADLDRIQTLGFRGEALPSIASVSRFRLMTRPGGVQEGVEIQVEGGRIREVKACGMAPGTVITIEHLFFNTPARLKFMKSAETEAGHAADIVARMAVSRPDVAFTCTSDGRELLKVQRSDILRRVAGVVGRDSSSHLFPVEGTDGPVTVSGFISGPQSARSTAQAMYTYINGRYVRDKVVQHAIMQAYRGVIERGRYPVTALFISAPPGEVDVNVHPTKHEVRFRQQSAVHDAIQSAVAAVLASSPWLQRPSLTPSRPDPDGISRAYRERIAAAAQVSLGMPSVPFFDRSGFSSPASADPAPAHIAEPSEAFSKTAASPASPGTDTPQAGDGYFSSLAVIGQFHGEYILCQSGEELVIIDQHAASERVAYQQLKQQHRDGAIESQRLLFPETVELSFSELALLHRHRADLDGIGFEIEEFGGNTALVAAVPRLAAGDRIPGLVRDILADLSLTGSGTSFQERLDDLFSRIACHSVVRGVTPLDRRQITELLCRMDETGFAASCPHGRPVLHRIPRAELEKIFKRS